MRFKECEDTYHLDESRVVVDDRMVLLSMSMLNIANFGFVRANLMWRHMLLGNLTNQAEVCFLPSL